MMCLFWRKQRKSEAAAAMLEGYARAYRVFQPQIDGASTLDIGGLSLDGIVYRAMSVESMFRLFPADLKEKVNLLLQINAKLELQLKK